jgi:hypothetical protein
MPAAADCSVASGFRQRLSDTHSHRDWLIDELAPGDAQHAVSDGTEHLPASVVTLERGPVTMSLPAVELDDDLRGRARRRLPVGSSARRQSPRPAAGRGP